MTNSTRDFLWGASVVLGAICFAILVTPWLYQFLAWYFNYVNGVFK